jgi:hypothetical protein
MSRIATEKRRLLWIRVDASLHEGNDWEKEKPAPRRLRAWQEDLSVLIVQLDGDGCVIGKHFERRSRMDLFHEIRARLNW